MIKACKEANKKLMIAYRCHYEPTNLRAMQLIRDGRLGKIQAIESANGFNATPNQWRLDRKLAGGGPLMDMGVYSLNACRYLTGEEPSEIKAFSSVIDHDGRFDTVEENVSWTMKFPSGAAGQLQHLVRRYDERVLPGARVVGFLVCGAGVFLPRAASYGAVRRPGRGQAYHAR